MRVYPLILGANDAQDISAQGSFFRCITGAAEFNVEAVDNSGASKGTFQDFQVGLGVVTPAPFTKLRITNGATPQTIELLVHDGYVEDNRLVGIVNITGGIDSKSLAPSISALSGRINVTNAATLVIAAGTRRGKALLQNCSASLYVAVGFGNTVTYTDSATAGIILNPAPAAGQGGGSVELETNTDIYAIASAAGPAPLRCLITEFST